MHERKARQTRPQLDQKKTRWSQKRQTEVKALRSDCDLLTTCERIFEKTPSIGVGLRTVLLDFGFTGCSGRRCRDSSASRSGSSLRRASWARLGTGSCATCAQWRRHRCSGDRICSCPLPPSACGCSASSGPAVTSSYACSLRRRCPARSTSSPATSEQVQQTVVAAVVVVAVRRDSLHLADLHLLLSRRSLAGSTKRSYQSSITEPPQTICNSTPQPHMYTDSHGWHGVRQIT